MKNIIYGLIAAAVLSICSGCSKSSEQAAQIAELTAKLKDKTDKEAFERQKACAVQSEKVVKLFGLGDGDSRRNHFNAKLNKCFFLWSTITIQKGSFKSSENLSDAYEGREYADMSQTHFFSKKDQSDVVLCYLNPIGETRRVCKSKEEYDAFVAQYMEESI